MKGVPTEIKAAIRKMAESEWPGDFTMQLHLVTEQFEAFKSVDALKSEVGESQTFKIALNNALEDYSEDYVMQLHVLKEQLSAAIKLAEFSGLTGDKCFEFKDNDDEAWTDKDMQMYFYRVDGGTDFY
ncbi:MAG: hypothetical protein R8K49_01225 [Mariprofundaceae bacterium]